MRFKYDTSYRDGQALLRYPVAPASHPQGTRVEVRDLFYATPARLKFLKSDRSEASNIEEIVTRIATTTNTKILPAGSERITTA